MGLDPNSLRFLLCANRMGVDLSRTLMVGRQRLNLGASELHDAMHELGFPLTREKAGELHTSSMRFADDLLRHLGADVVHSLDHSRYQDATLVHDLNEPVPEAWQRSYSTVIDCGTLEHVYNVPVALRSCAELVAPGGHYVVVSPTNNFLGHGFYQFSPELFFRVLSPQNQFEVRTCIVFTDDTVGRWYEVRDPDAVNARVTLRNSQPTYIAVLAQRIGDGPVLATAPQQSDYVRIWEQSPELDAGVQPATGGVTRRARGIVARLPDAWKAPLRRRIASARRRVRFRTRRRLDPAHYARVRPTDLIMRSAHAARPAAPVEGRHG